MPARVNGTHLYQRVGHLVYYDGDRSAMLDRTEHSARGGGVLELKAE
ncbi:hypothetical protein [Porphyromonas gulae]|nr:hypothetical protein [Porphyromonas gulae]